MTRSMLPPESVVMVLARDGWVVLLKNRPFDVVTVVSEATRTPKANLPLSPALHVGAAPSVMVETSAELKKRAVNVVELAETDAGIHETLILRMRMLVPAGTTEVAAIWIAPPTLWPTV